MSDDQIGPTYQECNPPKVGFGPPKRGTTITEDTIKAIQKEVEVQKFAADNYRRLLDESDHAYAELKEERDALAADAALWRAYQSRKQAAINAGMAKNPLREGAGK